MMSKTVFLIACLLLAQGFALEPASNAKQMSFVEVPLS
jgi:hypothetical protein